MFSPHVFPDPGVHVTWGPSDSGGYVQSPSCRVLLPCRLCNEAKVPLLEALQLANKILSEHKAATLADFESLGWSCQPDQTPFYLLIQAKPFRAARSPSFPFDAPS